MLLAAPASRAAGEDASQWRVLIEPKFMRPEVCATIANSEQTVLVAARWAGADVIYFSKKEFAALGVDWDRFATRARSGAADELAKLQPEFVRNKHKVIEYAVVTSTSPLTASAVLAPDFLKTFEPVFGPKILIAIPSRYCVFVFPQLAGEHRDYAPMVLEAYKATPYPVSREVFELSAGGLRAVGVYEEP